MATVELDAEFLALPLEAVRSAVLERASALGCEHAEARIERIRSQVVSLRDGRLETSADDLELGLGLRVVHDGSFGFAATVEIDVGRGGRARRPGGRDGAGHGPGRRRARRARRGAVATAPSVWTPPTGWTRPRCRWPRRWRCSRTGAAACSAAPGVDHVTASVLAVVEDKHFADLSGTVTTQRRVRVHPVVEATAVDAEAGGLRDHAQRRPAGRPGLGVPARRGLGLGRRARRIPELLAEKLRAPTVEPGAYDLVIDPTNLWLTIHESIGHATELDRALGYEAAYAGTSFATFDKLGTLALRVGGHERDRGPHRRPRPGHRRLRRRGRRGAELRPRPRRRPRRLPARPAHRAAEQGLGRSNGCAFADSPGHIPIQRMANVSLRPAPGDGPTTEELISSVDDGIYVVGDKSWSIDMQRYNFQFTGQRFFRIDEGQARRPGA